MSTRTHSRLRRAVATAAVAAVGFLAASPAAVAQPGTGHGSAAVQRLAGTTELTVGLSGSRTGHTWDRYRLDASLRDGSVRDQARKGHTWDRLPLVGLTTSGSVGRGTAAPASTR